MEVSIINCFIFAGFFLHFWVAKIITKLGLAMHTAPKVKGFVQVIYV